MVSQSSHAAAVSEKVFFNLDEIKPRKEPLKVLLCSPEFFDIIDVKNAHMEGQEGMLNKEIALKQWNDLKNIYEKLKSENIIDDVLVIDGAEDCEDMVFCANQTLPWIKNNGHKMVVLSKMRHASRQREVPYFKDFFAKHGYEILELNKARMFEGMGDTIPHPGKKLFYGGYGHRTDLAAYEEISGILNVPIVTIELPNENFYHLDTCFVPLSEDSVMLCKEAFTAEGLEEISKLFKNIFYIPEVEAIETFCLNAHVIINSGKGVRVAIIQSGSKVAKEVLLKNNYRIFETETGEFMKSGGSVFCMKMMMY